MRWIVMVMIAGIATGCAWEPENPSMGQTDERADEIPRVARSSDTAKGTSNVSGGVGWIVASIAQEQIGVPYRYGGSTPRGFDCSGLVHFAYAGAGIDVPRTTGALWQASSTVARADARPGDVLFFDIDGKPSHVGIYLGDGFFVHAPSSGKQVNTQRLDSGWYRDRLLRVGRLIP
ncbi:MAG: C40 family peptidase [Pseudomonadota bacterium]